MNTVISLILGALLVFACSKPLKKHPVPFYIAACVLAAGVFVVQLVSASPALPAFIYDYIWPVFFRGGLAGALFIIVMWTGALPDRSKLMRTLMPIRGELSILASILTLGHNASNGLTYFKYLFTDPSKLPVPTLLAACCSLVMICIMLPLFITSFKSVRRKMKASKWKKLQRLAYIFYGLLFTHLCLLYIPFILAGRNYYLTFIIYSLIYIGYAQCRILKYIYKKRKMPDKLATAQIIAAVYTVVITAAACVILMLGAKLNTQNIPQRNSQAATEDTTAPSQESKNNDVQNSPSLSEEASTDMANNKTVDSSIDSEFESNSDTKNSDNEISEETTDQTSEMQISETQTSASGSDSGKYADGTYTGSGNGYEGLITLVVTIENDVITDVTITDNIEDPEFLTPALKVIDEVYRKQNTDVDAVSGSTYSSYGILDAIDEALAAASQ